MKAMILLAGVAFGGDFCVWNGTRALGSVEFPAPSCSTRPTSWSLLVCCIRAPRWVRKFVDLAALPTRTLHAAFSHPAHFCTPELEIDLKKCPRLHRKFPVFCSAATWALLGILPASCSEIRLTQNQL